jgi:hypothetical protein
LAAVAAVSGAVVARLIRRVAVVVDGNRLWVRVLRWSPPIELDAVAEAAYGTEKGGAVLALRPRTGAGRRRRAVRIPLYLFDERAVLARVGGPLCTGDTAMDDRTRVRLRTAVG